MYADACGSVWEWARYQEGAPPERLAIDPGADGGRSGGARELQARQFRARNAELLPLDHDARETAAQLMAAELDVTRQQLLLTTMLRSVSEGVVIVDCNGHVLMENEAAIRIVGYSARLVGYSARVAGPRRWCEAVGAYPVDGDQPLAPDDMPTMRACRGEEVRGLELVLRGVAQDRNILIEVRASPLVGADGTIIGAIANFSDITERRHAAAVEARLAALVRSTPAAVITWDREGKVVDWNDGATAVLGYTADEMVGRDLTVLSMTGERGGTRADPGQALYDREVVMRRKDGRPVHLAWTEAPVHDSKGNFVGSAGVGADLSLRNHLEQQIARLADAQRRQLGQQVHDSLGQQLTAIGLLVGTLRCRLETGESVAHVISSLEHCVDDAKAQIRTILKGRLAPPEIDAHGLHFALEELAKATALTHGIACSLECPHPVPQYDDFTANEIYMIAREAVHNAVKHGRPRSIVIRLDSSHGLLLQVRDDGTGIAGAAVDRDQECFGFRIMRYRSRLIGATLDVARGAHGGTVLTCTTARIPSGGLRPHDAEPLPLQAA